MDLVALAYFLAGFFAFVDLVAIACPFLAGGSCVRQRRGQQRREEVVLGGSERATHGTLGCKES